MRHKGISNKFMPLTILAIILFIGLFSLDPIIYLIRFIYGVHIPLSSLLISISFVFIVRKISLINVEKQELRNNFIVLIFVFLILVVPLINNTHSYDTELLILGIRYLCFYFIGYYVMRFIYNYDNNRFIKKLLIVYPIFIISVALIFDLSRIVYDEEINYLRLSDGVAISGLFALAYSKKAGTYIFTLIIYTIALYFLFSRAAILFYLLTGLIILLFRFKLKKSLVYIISLIILTIPLLYIFNLFSLFSDSLYSQRLIRLFSQDQTDSSLLERISIFENGLQVIRNNWLLGEYGWQIRFYGDDGYYIHNILSYWAQFGLIVFLCSIFFIAYPFYYGIKMKSENKIAYKSLIFKNEMRYVLLLFWFFIVLNVLFSKSYLYDVILIPLGMTNFLYRIND